MPRSLERRAERAMRNIPPELLYELSKKYFDEFTYELEECGRLGEQLDAMYKSRNVNPAQDRLAEALSMMLVGVFRQFAEGMSQVNACMSQVIELQNAS